MKSENDKNAHNTYHEKDKLENLETKNVRVKDSSSQSLLKLRS